MFKLSNLAFLEHNVQMLHGSVIFLYLKIIKITFSFNSAKFNIHENTRYEIKNVLSISWKLVDS